MTDYLMALGSNLPTDENDLASTLSRALDILDQTPGVTVENISAWYRTPAWPEGSGPDFVNGAARLRSSMAPEPILQQMHEVEKALGRQRRVRWGARTCDLDLIAAGSLILPSHDVVEKWIQEGPDPKNVPDQIMLPHPRLHERSFVLVPLNEIAPDWVHPILQVTVEEMLARLPQADIEAVVRLPIRSGS